MDDDLEVIDDDEPVVGPAVPPILVVLPDPDSTADPSRPILGCAPLTRMAAHAEAAGFGGVMLAPGTRLEPPGALPVATGDPVRRPALVIFDACLVDPRLLRLMVEHPLEPDERFTLYDEMGRPTACFVGHLDAVPVMMPISEELPWPEGIGPAETVRLVFEEEDRRRAEDLVAKIQGVDERSSRWRRVVQRPTLRWLADSGRSIPQLELAALALAIGSLPLTLLGGAVGVISGCAALLAGVHLSELLPRVNALRALPSEALHRGGGSTAGAGSRDSARESEPVLLDADGNVTLRPRDEPASESLATPASEPRDEDERLAAATRPLGQAALMAGLTYVIVAEVHRSQVASVVLLAAGAAAALLSLFQARLLLRGRPADTFALPNAHAVARRLGLWWPSALDGSPFLELATFVAAIPGTAELPWSVMAAGAVARLWRWFSGPGDLLPRRASRLPDPSGMGSPDRP